MSQYDHAARRKAVRKGRERGCWVYIPAAELRAAQRTAATTPPYYRVWRSPRGSVLVRLYRES